MKIYKLLSLLAIGIVFTYCSDSDTSSESIEYKEINKTIVYPQQDSIDGNCKNLIFEINEVGPDIFTAQIRLNSAVIPCDGFNQILINSTNSKVELIEENQEILDSSNWGSVSGISLEDFAGKGEKYIGYRSGFYPLSSNRYNYGWIKIQLSEDQKTLIIISRGTNYEDNASIKAGQK